MKNSRSSPRLAVAPTNFADGSAIRPSLLQL
jgi:hypothetical protein